MRLCEHEADLISPTWQSVHVHSTLCCRSYLHCYVLCALLRDRQGTCACRTLQAETASRVWAGVEKLTCSPVELLVTWAVKLPMFVEYPASTDVKSAKVRRHLPRLATGSLHLQAGSIRMSMRWSVQSTSRERVKF